MTDPIGGTTWLASMQGLGGPQPGGFRQAIMTSASQVLGLSQQDIQTALGSGESLADLAQKQGVSSDQLVAALAQAIKTAAPGGSGGPASSDATAIAQRIVARKGGLGHHYHGAHGVRGGGSDPDGDGDVDGASGPDDDGASSPFSALSGLLGMDQSDLLAALESGSSLPDLLGQQGLTVQDLQASLGQGSAIDTTA